MVKFSLYSKFVWVIWTLYRRGKLLEHFILIAGWVSFKYFAFLSVCDKFELLGHDYLSVIFAVLLGFIAGYC